MTLIHALRPGHETHARLRRLAPVEAMPARPFPYLNTSYNKSAAAGVYVTKAKA